jgi:asparagine synthase (glutamine-hydrolysing)
MCGITGIVELDPRERVEADRLRLMTDALRHRGPDGEGLFVDGGVGLGHRRLAIVDVAGGRQPMTNEDGSLWIVCNGEIYNHLALREALEERGHRYRTRSDSETILHLYEEEGDACVERLSGMFAFALWDRARSRLLLVRDRLGIKPLYYVRTRRELLFASEVKALVSAGVRPVLDRDRLPELLASGFVSGESTLFAGVRRLAPGTLLTWSRVSGRVETRRYWRVPEAGDGIAPSLASAGAEVRKRLDAAVESHLMSDVPLGLFLSGGIDSAGLLGAMTRLAREPVRTFAVGFAEPEADELPYARLAARAAGAVHREVVVPPEAFFRVLPRLVWHEDEPIAFPSSVPLYFVSRLAGEDVKVVLTGEGADELFLGYNRYRVAALNERLGGAWQRLAPHPLARGVGAAVGGLPRALRRYAERSFLVLPPGPRSQYYENFAVFDRELREALLADPPLARSDPFEESLRLYAEGPGGPLERMGRADLQTYLVRLLAKQDSMSMAASIESRVPFLDHAFVEYVARLPGRLKLHHFQTKAVLRRALGGRVPPAILRRPKRGFPVPVSRWLRGRFSHVVDEYVLAPRNLERGLFRPAGLRRLADEHRSGRRDHGHRLWLLINLEIWQRLFVDGERSREQWAA